MKADFDIVIIGAGPSGMTAALYASRGGQKTVVLEQMAPGGQAATTDIIENYPGFPEGITGPDLTALMEKQARKFGAEFNAVSEVVGIETDGGLFKVKTGDKSVTGKAVIVASGAEHRKLGVKGEGELRGRGVSYCAVCDGAFFKDSDVAVVGGGNAAAEEAIYLTRYAKKVNLIHRRDRLRAAKVLADRVVANPKIEVIWDTVVEEISGDKDVGSVKTKNVKTNKVGELLVEGVFIYVGYAPNSDFLEGFLKLDENGFVVTDSEMKTEIPGVFACGDVRFKGLRQIINAAGEGATAAFSAEKYIEKIEDRVYGEFRAP